MSEPEILDTEAPDPPWRHRGERRRNVFERLSDRTPLRTKLITALLALVIMALAVTTVVSVIIVRRDLYTQRDQNLDQAFGRVTERAPKLGTASLRQGITRIRLPVGGRPFLGLPEVGKPALGEQHGHHFPGLGIVYESVPQLPTGQWAGSEEPRADHRQRAVRRRHLAGDRPGHHVDELRHGQAADRHLFVAVDLGPVNAELQRLILVELIVGASIVIVLAVVGVGVVRANLRPLDDIEMTAGEIAKGHLDHRVPEGDPRTEVGSLGRSLNAMLAQIERAFHAQEESEQAAHESEERMRRFIADASHELRTPLTTIRGFAAHYRMRGGAGGGRRGVGVGGGAGGGRCGRGQRAASGTAAVVGGSANGSSPGGRLVPGSADGVFTSEAARRDVPGRPRPSDRPGRGGGNPDGPAGRGPAHAGPA